jgi:hypothetical protein
MNGKLMRERQKGVAVKIRDKEEPRDLTVLQGGQTWKEVVKPTKSS